MMEMQSAGMGVRLHVKLNQIHFVTGYLPNVLFVEMEL